MNINLNTVGNVAVVIVEGRMDTANAPEFERCMQEWMAQGHRDFVVDLSRLDYISSAGLRSVLVCAKKARSVGGGMACCSLHGVVKKVFEVSGFAGMLPVYETLEQALGQ